MSYAGQSRLSLLLIDDDVDFLEVLVRRFLRRGHIVEACQDAARAMNVARQQRFDVVLVDRRLHAADGLDLARALLARDPTLRVVMLSGLADGQSRQDAVDAGVVEYLVKPCPLGEIEAAVARAWQASC